MNNFRGRGRKQTRVRRMTPPPGHEEMKPATEAWMSRDDMDPGNEAAKAIALVPLTGHVVAPIPAPAPSAPLLTNSDKEKGLMDTADVDINVAIPRESMVVLPEQTGEEAFVPLSLVKARIVQMMKEMTTLREQHVAALEDAEMEFLQAQKAQNDAFQDFIGKMKQKAETHQQRSQERYDALKKSYDTLVSASEGAGNDEIKMGSLIKKYEKQVSDLTKERNLTEKKLSEALKDRSSRVQSTKTTKNAPERDQDGQDASDELAAASSENTRLSVQLLALDERLAAAKRDAIESKEAYAFLSAKYEETKHCYKKLLEAVPAVGEDEELTALKQRQKELQEVLLSLEASQEHCKMEINDWAKAFFQKNKRKPEKNDKKAVRHLYKALEAADTAVTTNKEEQGLVTARIEEIEMSGNAGGGASMAADVARLQLEKTELQEENRFLQATLKKTNAEHEAALKNLELSLREELDKERPTKSSSLASLQPTPTTVATPQAANEEMAELRRLVEKLKIENATLAATQAAAAEAESTGPAEDTSHVRVAELSKELQKVKGQLERTQKDLAETEVALEAAKREHAKAKEDFQCSTSESTTALETQIKAAKDALAAVKLEHAEELIGRDNVLATAKARIEELEKELAEAKTVSATAAADKKALEEQMASVAEEAKEAAAQLAENAQLSEELAMLQREHATLQVSFKAEQTKRKQLHNKIEDMLGKIRVYARVRPMNSRETSMNSTKCVDFPDEYSVSIAAEDGSDQKEFTFDQVFPDGTPQDVVYERTSALIQSAIDGFNVCIFAYGQTGSGKTWTMTGDVTSGENKGIIPRAFEQVFRTFRDQEKAFRYSLKCYMLELYNKKLVDLLLPPNIKESQRPSLDIKMDKNNMVYVKDVTMRKAVSFDELMAIFDEGCSHRHTGATKMNAESSRSHLVFSMIIEAKDLKTGKVSAGKLSLVDLAGSESVGKTEATGERLKEAQAINSSLSALGNVISKLAKQEKFIPYRDDKLTLLMMDSLGGNAKTLMFVNLSPAEFNRQETISSLSYASRVKEIKNDASKNVDSAEVARLKKKIKELLGNKEDDGDA